MKLKFLFLTTIFQSVNCFSFISFDFMKNNYEYTIESIEGERSKEIEKELSKYNEPLTNYRIKIFYRVTDYQRHPTVHINYTIQTQNKKYTRYYSLKASNNPLPWKANSSFPKIIAFYLNLHIQKSIKFIEQKEKHSKSDVSETNELENELENEEEIEIINNKEMYINISNQDLLNEEKTFTSDEERPNNSIDKENTIDDKEDIIN